MVKIWSRKVLGSKLKFVKAFIFGSLNIKEAPAKVLKPVCPTAVSADRQASGDKQVW